MSKLDALMNALEIDLPKKIKKVKKKKAPAKKITTNNFLNWPPSEIELKELMQEEEAYRKTQKKNEFIQANFDLDLREIERLYGVIISSNNNTKWKIKSRSDGIENNVELIGINQFSGFNNLPDRLLSSFNILYSNHLKYCKSSKTGAKKETK